MTCFAKKFISFFFQDKVVKFANYFLSRKHVQSLKNAVAVLQVTKTFTDNKVGIMTYVFCPNINLKKIPKKGFT